MSLNFLNAQFLQSEENLGLTHHAERIWSCCITTAIKKMSVSFFKKEQNSVYCSLANDSEKTNSKYLGCG